MHQRLGTQTDKYSTDSWIMAGIFGNCDFDMNWWDPCPIEWNRDLHACSLAMEWEDEPNIFINPPYSNPKPWVEKAIETNKKYGATVVMLLKHDSSTRWYRLLHEAGAHILLFSERLKHNTGKACAFPSMLAVLY